MASKFVLLPVLMLLVGEVVCRNLSPEGSFDQKYEVLWGGSHFLSLEQGRQVQLSMDKASGSGFASKLSYGSGLFHLKIKLPGNYSAGVITAFYLASNTSNHDELDFEFLGNKKGELYTLQTNIFAKGVGNREQRMPLWFDPTEDFHTYKVLWNRYQIVFFVDDNPIRVFKNESGKGVAYPTAPMTVIASLWDGDNWATDGGRTKINWAYAPFTAHFQGFNIDGCPSDDSNTRHCSSSNLWWNSHKYARLSPRQQKLYQYVKENYINYDYCEDKKRFKLPPTECPR